MIEDADVIIVGSGIGGAAVFRSLCNTSLRVVVLEDGGALSPNGIHLRNLIAHHEQSWRALVSATAKPPVRFATSALANVPPAGPPDAVRLDQLVEESLPGLANCCAVGGNGLIWSGIVLPPASSDRTGIAEDELEEAANWLNAQIVPDSPRQKWLEEVHHLQPVPLAWSIEDGWVGPNELAGSGFQPQARYSVRRIVHHQGRASGVEVRIDGAAKHHFIAARHIVVAGGVVGTMRLLWTSGLGQDLSGLGRGIIHHPVAIAQAAIPESSWLQIASKPGLDRPAAARVFPAPPGGHTLITFEPAWMMENRVDSRAILSIYAYRTLERHSSRQVSFVPETPGLDGLLLPRFIVPPSTEEKACEECALEEARLWAAKLGITLPSGRPAVLPRGADQHLCGGASIGAADDPFSVAEPSGKVRSMENVWVAGAAALPDAVSTHPAQTIVALAARTGRELKALLIND